LLIVHDLSNVVYSVNAGRTHITADINLRFAPCGSWWQWNTSVYLCTCNH